MADLSLLGWPKTTECTHCGARSALLVSTGVSASYECRGTPTEEWSAYGPDRGGRVFEIMRSEEEAIAAIEEAHRG